MHIAFAADECYLASNLRAVGNAQTTPAMHAAQCRTKIAAKSADFRQKMKEARHLPGLFAVLGIREPLFGSAAAPARGAAVAEVLLAARTGERRQVGQYGDRQN